MKWKWWAAVAGLAGALAFVSISLAFVAICVDGFDAELWGSAMLGFLLSILLVRLTGILSEWDV